MKRVELKRKLTPPGNGELTKHVIADWVFRHEDGYEIQYGDGKVWNLGAENVQSLTDTEYPFSPVEPDEDRRTGGNPPTRVQCPVCGHQFSVSPDFDTGELVCYQCNSEFYGHLHIRSENR